MKTIYPILILLLLSNCGKGPGQHKNVDFETSDSTETEVNRTRYTDQQLENFLDSIGSLSPSTWASNVAFVADSIFNNQLQLNRVISEKDFSKLKRALLKEDEIDRAIDVNTAIRIFGSIDEVDSSFIHGNRIPLTFYSFDKRKEELNEYALCLGNPYMSWSCVLYFLKGNQIISRHTIYHRYGLDLKHYKDKDNKTVIYYKENFVSGTGVWQFNYYFYTFDDNKLIPVLNVLQNGNLNGWASPRSFWLESFVTDTSPLTLKMVYNTTLVDTLNTIFKLVDDSTFVQFNRDESSQTLVGEYDTRKINANQVLSYYVADNELLFINTHYSLLKNGLNDTSIRAAVLNYLNEIKNRDEY
jgi:hypothetical protein